MSKRLWLRSCSSPGAPMCTASNTAWRAFVAITVAAINGSVNAPGRWQTTFDVCVKHFVFVNSASPSLAWMHEAP